jgi:hypothetical protein
MRCYSHRPYHCCGRHPTTTVVTNPQGAVLEKEEVVVDQGGRYDDDEYEGGCGPAFTPPPSHTPATMVRRVASTMATMAWRQSGLARWQQAASEIRLAAGDFDNGDHNAAAVRSRAACGGSGRPQRSDWQWAASTTAATARRWSGLARRRWAASEIRLAAGGFNHGGHGLHHGGTTSMVVSPDLSSMRLDLSVTVFFILEN